MASIILQTVARYLLPLLLLFSVFVAVRGHNAPGGGFVGGLIAAGAFILHGIAYGPSETQRALAVDPRTLIGVGVLLAVGSGLVGLFAGRALLTGLWIELELPAMGKIPLGTPLLFDAGVYVGVLGTTLAIILPLSEE